MSRLQQQVCTFEAAASKLLVRPYVQLALWGVPLPETAQSWQSALEIDGAVIDLSVDKGGIRARSDRPIVMRDHHGNIDRDLFPSRCATAGIRSREETKRPHEQWVPVERRVTTNLAGLRMQVEFGADLFQMALKMSLAGASLLPRSKPMTCSRQAVVCDKPSATFTARRAIFSPGIPGIDSVRQSGARAVRGACRSAACRTGPILRRLPSFLWPSANTRDEGRIAVFGWLDPVTLNENWIVMEAY